MALADEFALDLSRPARAQNRGLAQRLVDGTPTAAEAGELQRTEDILRLQDQGLTIPQMATDLSFDPIKLGHFLRTQKYRVYRKYLTERDACTDEILVQQRRANERRRWDGFAGHALDWYQWAMRRHQRDVKHPKTGVVLHKKGDPIDADRYERAAKLIAESQGWTVPPTLAAKPRDVKPGVIQGVMAAVAAADRRETVVRVTTQTIEVATRETAAEEATLG